jgi:hypothetical protein
MAVIMKHKPQKGYSLDEKVKLPDGRIGRIIGQEPIGEYRVEVSPDGTVEYWYEDDLQEAEPVHGTAYYAERGE